MKNTRLTLNGIAVIGCVVFVLFSSGCKSLRDAVEVMRRPEVRIADTELEALSFSGLTILFDVEVENPNPIGIRLSGFDYDLQIEGNPFVSGEVQDKVAITARDLSIIPVPVELGFEEIAQTIGALAPEGGKEEAAYEFTAGFSFDLPVLGRVRMPVRTEGTFPILRVPRLEIIRLSLNEISLSGASLDLELELINRNSFKILIESLEYRFQVEGRDWASGMRQERVKVGENDSTRLTIPVELDFQALGRGLYQMILGGEGFRYTFDAKVEVSTSQKALKAASLPFELNGELRAQR
jgi:LEA14-like dessication related protein